SSLTDRDYWRACLYLIRCKCTSENARRSNRVEKCGRYFLNWYVGVLLPALVQHRDDAGTERHEIEADALHARQRSEPRRQLLLKDLRTFRVITTQFQAVTHGEKVLRFIP